MWLTLVLRKTCTSFRMFTARKTKMTSTITAKGTIFLKNPPLELVAKAQKKLTFQSKHDKEKEVKAYQWDGDNKILRLPRYWTDTPRKFKSLEPMCFDGYYPFKHPLYDHQQGPALELKEALKKYKGAVGVAPPGSGKTVVGLNMIHELCPRRAIVVVDTDSVRDQWIEAGRKFLDIDIKRLTFKKKIEKGVYVTTYSAMTKHPNLFHECELLILDEADVAAAPKFVNCVFGTNFRISVALTATPDRSDHLDVVYRMLAAPTRS
jgi:superfamily II DNA or RNA helicase